MKLNIGEIKKKDPLTKNERLRSNFVQRLVQNSKEVNQLSASALAPPPKQIVQFWDNLERLPKDVEECMESWRKLEQSGFDLQVFDEESAKEFIKTHLGSRFEKAFVKCYHPSMKSDYFRYSYIFVKGGFYIDADDVYHGGEIDHLFIDGRMKLQPFCYDIETSQMVPATVFTNSGANSWSWIFYFNNTPLIAAKNHPIIERTLLNATVALESKDGLPKVQSTTGPGILTKTIFEMLSSESNQEKLFLTLNEWEKISTSRWQLSYRNDKRNWRLSDQQTYQAAQHNE